MDANNLFKVRAVLQVIIAAFEHYFALLQKYYGVDQVQKIDGMSNKYASLLCELAHKDLFENFLLDIGIQGRYWIVHQHYGSVRVDGACQADPSLLASG